MPYKLDICYSNVKSSNNKYSIAVIGRKKIKKGDLKMQEQSKGLKIFGIISIILGVIRFGVMIFVTSQAKMDSLHSLMNQSQDFDGKIKKAGMTWDQMVSFLKVDVYIFAALALIFGVVIGALAIKGAQTGNVKALKIMLIIQLIALIFITFGSLIKPIFAILSFVAFVLAIVGLVLASKAKKQH